MIKCSVSGMLLRYVPADRQLAVVAAHAVPLENAVALALIDLGPVCHWDDQLVVRRDLSAAKC